MATISDLSDVSLANLSNYDILQYNSTTALWENNASPNMASGSISTYWYVSGSVFGGLSSITSRSTATGTIYYMPFYVCRTTTYTAIGIYIAATAAGNSNMCIYADSGNSAPTGSPLAGSTSGSVANATNTATTFTFSSPITLDTGLHWLAVTVSGTNTIEGNATSSGRGGIGLGIGTTITTTTLATPTAGWKETFVYSTTMPTVGSLTQVACQAVGDMFVLLKAQ